MPPKVFSWQSNPAVGQYVIETYPTHASGELSSAIFEKFGVYLSPGAIRKYYSWRKSGGGEPPPVVQPGEGERFPDRRMPATDEDLLELYDLAMQQTERAEAAFIGQTQATVDFSKESKPIAFAFWSDWQIGSKGVLMRALLNDAKTIQDTEGLYVFVMGDLIQNLNQRKHPSSLHECVLPDPKEQEECALYLLKKVQHKVLGMVTGNHEENLKVASGFSLTERWAKELDVNYFWHGAKVNVKVGHQTYKIGVRHKYKNESAVNTTNAQRMMHNSLWPDADAICLGHLHYNDLQKIHRPLGDTIYLRAGSYQRTDDYGMSSGHYSGQWGIPILVCYPDVRQIVPFFGRDFLVGLQFLEDQRNRYK